MEYRVNNRPNCNLFDLIGRKEPDQTKSLGLLLSRSELARNAILKLILSPQDYNQICTGAIGVVDCEFTDGNPNNRADIVIRFYDTQHRPICFILIEAKSFNNNATPISAVQTQLNRYVNGFCNIMMPFGSRSRYIVALTNNATFIPNSNILTITWKDILDAQCGLLGRNQKNKSDLFIIENYIKYLIKIQKVMYYYDHEVLSIPAGNTYQSVKTFGIYECPTQGKQYVARGQSHPIFVAFREKGGVIKQLYKVLDVIKLDIQNYGNNQFVDPSIVVALNNEYYNGVVNNINGYFANHSNLGEKFVFILDLDNIINLPIPKKISWCQNHAFLTLKDCL